jgi:uncharacterized protein (DUF427 family)
MKQPGPDHPIAITPEPRRVRVTFGGETVVDTTRALRLQEASYPVVLYVPREDASMVLLAPSTRQTHCPYKGDASYFSIDAGGKRAPDAVWSYETPFPAMASIAGHLAFYPDRVDAIEVG